MAALAVGMSVATPASMQRSPSLLAFLVVTSCSATQPPTAPGLPPGKADQPGFEVEAERTWLLVSDAVTAGHDTYRASVSVPDHVGVVNVWLNRQWVGQSDVESGRASVEFDATQVAPGTHEVLFQADNEPFAFAQRQWHRSAPVYVVVSTDWDTPDNADASLRRQEQLHERHPQLKITHLVGPYTFTDPDITPARQQRMVQWVTDMRDRHDDEIGLHIHVYCSFVEHVGQDCHDQPSFASERDASGRTVRLGVYSEDEFVDQLNTAIALFEDHGLGRPTSSRAGGWTLEAHTMRALDRAGFVVDSSAANWRRMEEWDGHATGDLFDWVRRNWRDIDERSQPYFPSRDDLLSAARPTVSVLEAPDNGLLVDYVTADEMIEMFDANYDGTPQAEPVAYSIGYHPPNFSDQFLARMDGALDHIDRHLAADDLGPVTYVRMSDLAQVWTREP